MKLKWLQPRCDLAACPNHKRYKPAWLGAPEGIWFAGRRLCSPDCFESVILDAVLRLLPTIAPRKERIHRVPLGLLLLTHGYTTNDELKAALQGQRKTGIGRVGEWLRRVGGVTEQQVTAALGMQWACPIFPLQSSRRFLECADFVPLAILESLRMVPVHYLPQSRQLYVAFADWIDYTALRALEHMLDCRTQPALADESSLERALDELRRLPRTRETLFDSLHDPVEMARTARGYAASLHPHEARLVACDEYLWFRIASARQINHLVLRVVPQTL